MVALGSSANQRFGRADWPWRGLGVALLLALLAHLSAWMLVHQSFAWSFQHPDSAASMSTRLLEPVPISILPPAAAPSSTQAPEQSAKRVPASQAPSAAQISSDAQNEPKIESNQPVALIESVPSATETVANELPDEESVAPSPTPINTTPVAGQNAPPGIKLQYPPSVQLEFDGLNMDKGVARAGSATLDWKTDGNGYELTLEASALVIFTRTEKSVGQLTPQGLAPQRYSSVRTARSEQATHFRPELGSIQFSNNKPDAQLLVGAQDRLSVLIQLAGILGGDPERYRIVNRIQMQVAGLDSAEMWEFNLQGLSDINVPAANMQALKLSRTPRNEFDQKLEVWLSPQLGYLPIRIRQSSNTTPDQDFTDLVLRKIP